MRVHTQQTTPVTMNHTGRTASVPASIGSLRSRLPSLLKRVVPSKKAVPHRLRIVETPVPIRASTRAVAATVVRFCPHHRLRHNSINCCPFPLAAVQSRLLCRWSNRRRPTLPTVRHHSLMPDCHERQVHRPVHRCCIVPLAMPRSAESDYRSVTQLAKKISKYRWSISAITIKSTIRKNSGSARGRITRKASAVVV